MGPGRVELVFNDLHAMLAFVGAEDWKRAQHLERVLVAERSRPTRHGETTRRLGLQAEVADGIDYLYGELIPDGR